MDEVVEYHGIAIDEKNRCKKRITKLTHPVQNRTCVLLECRANLCGAL
jgi:hypothetical protein